MNCPHCQASQTRKLDETTDLGYAVFRCGQCKRKFNERTGSPFNHLEFPTDIVFQVVLCRLRYKLSLRDWAEMFLLRGWEFTHEAVREESVRSGGMFKYRKPVASSPFPKWVASIIATSVEQPDGRGKACRSRRLKPVNCLKAGYSKPRL
jgi:hypothetical protein